MSTSPDPLSPMSSGSVSSFTSSVATAHSDKIVIPEHWREETENCINEGVLDDLSRSDIVRTLVTLLVAKHGHKPPKAKCEALARQLILKFPFMRDDLGNGYVSVSSLSWFFILFV